MCGPVAPGFTADRDGPAPAVRSGGTGPSSASDQPINKPSVNNPSVNNLSHFP